jgi:hypothetical protein
MEILSPQWIDSCGRKYWDGEMIAKNYFKDDGSPQTDTSLVNSSATFKKGGNEAG